MKYKLRTLSPLHIGCGETYNGVSFLLDKRKKPNLISVLDEKTIFEALNEKQVSQFVKWVEKEQFPNLFIFLQKELGDRSFFLQNQLQKRARYSIPSLAGEEKIRDINAFIKQANTPYIPGTEIKGAIRTAIFYCAFQNNQGIQNKFVSEINKILDELILKGNGSNYKNYIESVKNRKEPDRKKKSALVSRIKRTTQAMEAMVFNGKHGDAKYDLMKFLQVGDTSVISPDSLAVSCVKLFGASMESPMFNEYLKSGLDIPISSLKVEMDISRNWRVKNMGFSSKQEYLVSNISTILENCHRFSKDLLDEEITYFIQHGKTNIAYHLQAIAALNTHKSPVLRIGKDEGYNSVTIGLAVKKIMPELYNDVLIHTTKGKSYDEEHGGPLPKSRKIVQWNKSELTAGWVQLIPDEQPVKIISSKKINEEIPKQEETVSKIDLSVLRKKFN